MRKNIANRLLMLLAMLFGALSVASAADRFYIDATNFEPGETKTIAFNLENSQEFFGFQADISLPDGLEIVQVNGKPDCTLSSRADASYSMVTNQLSAGTLRFGTFSTTHTAIIGNSGALLYVKAVASEAFAGGTLSVSNILFTDKANNDVQFTDYAIEIGNKHIDNFYIPDFKISAGETKEVSIMLDNETQFTAFQTDIYLPEGLAIVDNSPMLTTRCTDHTLSSKNISDRCVRIAGFSLNSTQILGNSGALVKFNVVASDDFASPCFIEMKNQIFATTDAKERILPNSQTKITTKVESILLNHNELTLHPGQNCQFIATIVPEDATDYTLTWQSSNPMVATIDNSGLLEALSEGKTVITVTADSSCKDECLVTVSQTSGVFSISLDNLGICMTKGTILVKDVTAGQKVCLYDLQGNLLASRISQGEDIKFDVQSGKIYIISIGKIALKVIVP